MKNKFKNLIRYFLGIIIGVCLEFVLIVDSSYWHSAFVIAIIFVVFMIVDLFQNPQVK